MLGAAPLAEADRTAFRELARDAARRSMVLLQNRGGVLPLGAPAGRLAVLGPLADAPGDMLGPWSGIGEAGEAVSFAAGLRTNMPGWQISVADTIEAACEAADGADAVLLCLGETPEMCGEGGSRADPGLPPEQRALAEAVLALGKPVIAVLTCGRPLIAPWLFERADAVLAAWFPGSEAGAALADVLTGRHNPAARLPVTWPRAVGQIPLTYTQRPSGRPADPAVRTTSRYLDVPNEPQFPFGHGLSYTRFACRALRVTPDTVRPGGRFTAEAEIASEDGPAGEVTVLLFMRPRRSAIARPLLSLAAAVTLALPPGACASARFDLSTDDLHMLDAALQPGLEAGEYELLAGFSADRAALAVATLKVEV